jgi:hypothetical protein
MLNPKFAALRQHAGNVDWRLPPSCNAILRLDALAAAVITPSPPSRIISAARLPGHDPATP